MSENETQISRVIRSKEEAKASYDKISKWYNIVAGRCERKYRETGLQMLSAKEGEIILEIGFGTGHCVLALARSVSKSGKIYGIDISEGMCKIAGSRIKEAGLTERVELRYGDAVNLPFESNFFDAIYISFTLELFDTPEIPIVLSECQRVLNSNGRICVVAMSKEGKSGIMIRLYEWLHKKFPKFIDCRPIFLRKSLHEANFQIINVVELPMWGLLVEIVLVKKP
ncbi:class I SAM-dependent methyltransferase [candidate division KSB1 bacterium]